MAEIVNLREARKRKARVEKDKTAETNRVAYGKPSPLRRAEEIEAKRLQARHDGHRLNLNRDAGDPK